MTFRQRCSAVCFFSPLVMSGTLAVGQSAQSAARLVQGPINLGERVTLSGTVLPQANRQNDAGPLDAATPLHHMLLQLRRPDNRENAFKLLIEQQHDPASPMYHQWLSATQVGEQFGPNPDDVSAVTSWLGSQGFVVNKVSRSRMVVDFSGTAGQVTKAFSSPLHHLIVNGEQHIANMEEPRIPAALSPVIEGISTLNDFEAAAHKALRPTSRTQAKLTSSAAAATPDAETSDPKVHGIVPDDIHTIYDFKPAFREGFTGKGQRIAVAEPADLYSVEDWNTFRTTFGLSRYKYGKLIQTHPGGCTDPGSRPDAPFYGIEVASNAEWASAGAPNATIEVASCAGDEVGYGVLKAVLGLVDEDEPPSAISISYIRCESAVGPATEATIRYAYQQAASEGISVFSTAADVGGSACDFAVPVSETGLSVSAYASTPYNVAVGGSEFTEVFNGTTAQYWRTTDRASYGSANSYIPEAALNYSCGSTLLANYFGFAVSYGANGFCNSDIGQNFLNSFASGGGASGCAYGQASSDPSQPAVSGTCKGYAKPIYQKGTLGVPTDGLRDLPDISIIAPVLDNFFIICYSDPANPYGVPCTGDPLTWETDYGTAASTPILAGVQALINEHEGAPQGNPNYVYYALARKEFGTFGNQACNASLGKDTDSSCVFHDITEGDNDIPCLGPFNCFDPSGTYGVLSRRDKSFSKAYNANLGWDFATGLGSFDVTNLIHSWDTAPLSD